MHVPHCHRAAACAVAASLALGGSAAAAQAADTTVDVSPRAEFTAPDRSPVAFPGITRVREGAPLPRGWVVVSRDVRITRGAEDAFGAFQMTCPRDKTWRSGRGGDDIRASVLDRNARKRSVLVLATFSTSAVRVGETAAGTVYALCR